MSACGRSVHRCNFYLPLSHISPCPKNLFEMAETVGKRKAETDLWERHKPLLKLFFMDQNRTLKDIRDIMAKDCGFDRKYDSCRAYGKPRLTRSRPHQYELRFKNWGFRKNFSGKELKRAKTVIEQRKLKGKMSLITRGALTMKSAQKRAERHFYETTYEKMLRRQMGISNMRKTTISEKKLNPRQVPSVHFPLKKTS